jgi:hypothetical protein
MTQYGIAFLPRKIVYSSNLTVIALQEFASFCVIQSRVHELWARQFASTLKDDLAYAPSDCFETFPFPLNYETNPTLESVGKTYHEFRADLMVRNDEGLTKTYNRFHDPEERSPDILKLRELHAAMDKAVLEAYGWHDLAETAACEFLLDYEEDEDDEESTGGRRRKKPWRFRWPDDFRDGVLARLLELNRQRAEEERLAGLAAGAASKKPAGRAKGKKTKAVPGMLDLFETREPTE